MKYKLNEAIKLDNGNLLVNAYDKYEPKMTFIVPESEIDNFKYEINSELVKQINIKLNGDPTFMYGKYFISKKGTKCFQIGNKNSSPHILCKLSWGGAFNKTNGFRQSGIGKEAAEIEIGPGALHFISRRSNGGGVGCDYFIIPRDFRKVITIDDI